MCSAGNLRIPRTHHKPLASGPVPLVCLLARSTSSIPSHRRLFGGPLYSAHEPANRFNLALPIRPIPCLAASKQKKYLSVRSRCVGVRFRVPCATQCFTYLWSPPNSNPRRARLWVSRVFVAVPLGFERTLQADVFGEGVACGGSST